MLPEFLNANTNTAVLVLNWLTLMETLLRQKVCKSKHNFLITKQLEEKKDERKKRKKTVFFRSERLGIYRVMPFLLFVILRATSIRARRDLHSILGYKKT